MKKKYEQFTKKRDFAVYKTQNLITTWKFWKPHNNKKQKVL